MPPFRSAVFIGEHRRTQSGMHCGMDTIQQAHEGRSPVYGVTRASFRVLLAYGYGPGAMSSLVLPWTPTLARHAISHNHPRAHVEVQPVYAYHMLLGLVSNLGGCSMSRATCQSAACPVRAHHELVAYLSRVSGPFSKGHQGGGATD